MRLLHGGFTCFLPKTVKFLPECLLRCQLCRRGKGGCHTSAAPSLWEQGTPETALHRAAAGPGGLLGCLCCGCPSRLHPGRTRGHVQEGGLSLELHSIQCPVRWCWGRIADPVS